MSDYLQSCSQVGFGPSQYGTCSLRFTCQSCDMRSMFVTVARDIFQILFHSRKDSSSKIHLWGVKRSFLEFIYCSRVGHVRTTLVDWEDICHN